MNLKDELLQIFEENINYTSAIGIDNIKYEVFKENIERNLEIIENGILNSNYKFSNYKEKLISKGAYKEPRIVSIPTIRDKLVLKYIQKVLMKNFNYLKQKLPNERIRELQKGIGKYSYISQYDIEKFYDNINHNILINQLKRKGFDEENFLYLIKSALKKNTIVMYSKEKKAERNKGVPQGLPISNILAEIYLSEVINSISYEKCEVIKYVDDIIILHNQENTDVIKSRFEADINRLGLSIHQGKSRIGINYKTQKIRFLGYEYCQLYNKNMYGFSVTKESIHKFQRKIIACFIKYEKNSKVSREQFIFTLNNLITGSISTKLKANAKKTGRYGWLFYYSQIDDYTIPYNLDKFIKILLDKFKRKKSGKWSEIEETELKSFQEAFRAIRKKKYDYIHRPDELTLEERKELLIKVFNINSNILKNKEVIDKAYYKFVYKPMRMFEKDIHYSGGGA